MTFGLQSDEATSRGVLDRAAEGGINFIDTADVYPLGGGVDLAGRTEEIVGRWMKGRRQEFVVATKCFGRTGQQVWDVGNNRRHILDAIDASLRRLGTDYVDLYQLHQDDPETPLDETLRALDDLVRSGKVRYIGCSNFQAYRIALALGRSDELGTTRFVSAQPRYNLLFRQVERDLLPLAQEEGVGVIPYNPLAGGMLSGKHRRGEKAAEGTRFTIPNAGQMYQERYFHDAEFAAVEAFEKVAAEAGLKPATLAIAWVMHRPAITAPIIGASRAEQLDDTIPAVEADVSPDLVARLNELTAEFRRGDAPR
jgi:aryl-alcohol dehydrogenase (NADP+)